MNKDIFGTIRRMRYFYRRYRIAKGLRENCRKNAPKKELSFPAGTGLGTITVSKDEKVPKEPFVDWFSRYYSDNLPTFRHWGLWPKIAGTPKNRERHNEMVKYFHSIMDDLIAQKLVGTYEEQNRLVRIYVNPLSGNEFIDGFWYRGIFKILDNTIVKTIIISFVIFIFSWLTKVFILTR